ncbi:Membrane-bound lytic murein transglycosylase C (EC 3.2.1.n1) [hydrothermal vent metagenome]|uniref:Membrane-bound lytic murein transglycosylase C n=1 Tax=hydrothermal vent metagenome TaxID=652676 RepID=A0A3B0Z5S5_9ZZZZ
MGTHARRVKIRAGMVFIVLSMSLSASSLLAAANKELESEFLKWQSSMQQEFIDYAAQEQKEYAAYKKEIEKQWQEFSGSTKKDWVEYSADKSTRSKVDFEIGEIVLEVVIPVEDPDAVAQTVKAEQENKQEQAAEAAQKKTEQVAKRKAAELARKKKLRKIALDKIKRRLAQIIADKSINKESPVQQQIKNKSGQVLTEKNVDKFVEQELAKKLIIEQKPYIAKDGKIRVVAQVKVAMVPEHLRIRADKFKDPVETYSRKYNIDSALIFAVIHTESHFNPKARSHIPAYGLMQLVPSSGGLDAYRFVKGKDQKPSPSYLYDPTNNIELGVAYLKLLSTREFRKVSNDLTKKYLIVASYNTGAGNVSRVWEGRRNLKASVQQINTMEPNAVYQKLIAELPYEETRKYLKKIVKREKIYQNF